MFFPIREALFKKAKTKAKKKPRKRSDSSGGYNLSDIIRSPASTGQWERDSFQVYKQNIVCNAISALQEGNLRKIIAFILNTIVEFK